MATDGAALMAAARSASADAAAVRSPAAPIARQVGLDRPFFDDKNRAFWILQTAGWTGYFILRTLSGFANSMGPILIVHIAILTATGYSLTLLMASLFRRLIAMKPVWTLILSLAVVVLASATFSIIETWSVSTFLKPDLRPTGVAYLGAIILDFALLAAWAALYYGINYFLLLEDEIKQRETLEGQASSAQLAMLRYQLNPHFLFNTLNSLGAGERDAGAPFVIPALHAGQRAHCEGDVGAGGGDPEAVPRDRENAVRGQASPALQDPGGDDRSAAPVASTPAKMRSNMR